MDSSKFKRCFKNAVSSKDEEVRIRDMMEIVVDIENGNRNTMKGVNKAYNKLLKVNKNRRKVNGLKLIDELVKTQSRSYKISLWKSPLWKTLNELANFQPDNKNPEKGRDLFGDDNSQEGEIALEFFKELRKAMMRWGSDFGKEEDGKKNPFYKGASKIKKGAEDELAKSGLGYREQKSKCEDIKKRFQEVRKEMTYTLIGNEDYEDEDYSRFQDTLSGINQDTLQVDDKVLRKKNDLQYIRNFCNQYEYDLKRMQDFDFTHNEMCQKYGGFKKGQGPPSIMSKKSDNSNLKKQKSVTFAPDTKTPANVNTRDVRDVRDVPSAPGRRNVLPTPKPTPPPRKRDVVPPSKKKKKKKKKPKKEKEMPIIDDFEPSINKMPQHSNFTQVGLYKKKVHVVPNFGNPVHNNAFYQPPKTFEEREISKINLQRQKLLDKINQMETQIEDPKKESKIQKLRDFYLDPRDGKTFRMFNMDLKDYKIGAFRSLEDRTSWKISSLLKKETLLYDEKDLIVTQKKQRVLSKDTSIKSGLMIKLINNSLKEMVVGVSIMKDQRQRTLHTERLNLEKGETVPVRKIINKEDVHNSLLEYKFELKNQRKIWRIAPLTILDFIVTKQTNRQLFLNHWGILKENKKMVYLKFKNEFLDEQIAKGRNEIKYYFDHFVMLDDVGKELGMKIWHVKNECDSLMRIHVEGGEIGALMLCSLEVEKEALEIMRSFFILLTVPSF